MPVIYQRLLLTLALPLFLSSCASPIGESANAFDHYLNEEATMLVISPNELEAKETDVKEIIVRKGQRVRLVERGGSSTLIETMNGERGRVPTLSLEESDPNDTGEPQAKMGKTIKW